MTHPLTLHSHAILIALDVIIEEHKLHFCDAIVHLLSIFSISRLTCTFFMLKITQYFVKNSYRVVGLIDDGSFKY
jgi:hypothetical protein